MPKLDPRIALVQSGRSFLFVPGDRPERFDNAAHAGADALIIDLEDGVAPQQKARARTAAAAWIDGGGFACVRVNPFGGPDHDADIEAFAGLEGLIAVVLSKTASAQAASAVATRSSAPVIAMIESAVGILNALSIAAANGVVRLAFGHLDYAVDIGCDSGYAAMMHARSSLVLASRAAGLPGPIDGVTVALTDPGVLAEDIAQARMLGLPGKLLIHPRQVDATHVGYQPTDTEVTWALRVLSVAGQSSEGAVGVDGEMVDAPVIARAQDIVRRRKC